MQSNPLKKAWAEGRTTFGVWSMIPDAFASELVAGAGYDYVCVDGQHGLADFSSMVSIFQSVGASGAAPLTRVLTNDAGLIGRSLDAGAMGVIVPLVNNAEEAARAVAACRYPPGGLRSYGPVRASEVIRSKDPADLDGEVLCFVMVETREGLEKVEEIAATPGLDGIYIGPADLALSLGLAPTLEITENAHIEAVCRIRDACRRNGIVASIHCGAGEWARKHAEAGFDMVTVTMDTKLLTEAARRELEVARGGRSAKSD
ncbi:aldolase/citrate lyase family protein [soil metagenome]